ncbi:MAG: DUF1891 domain-containing protein [Bacteroidetes bacterium]|nr:MAG: DUF1891 domain-containing protein [Bacteroidota bacterium]
MPSKQQVIGLSPIRITKTSPLERFYFLRILRKRNLTTDFITLFRVISSLQNDIYLSQLSASGSEALPL